MFVFLTSKLERYAEYVDVNSESLLLGRSHSSRSWGGERGGKECVGESVREE